MFRGLALVVGLSAMGCGRLEFDLTRDARTELTDAAVDDAANILPPSCAGQPTCRGVSCCASAIVPAASYFRSYDVSGDGLYGMMTFAATVDGFRLDRFEITVGRFRTFLAAGQGTSASPPAVGAGARALNGQPSVFGWRAAWSTSLLATRAALEAALYCDPSSTWTTTAGANDNKALNCLSWYEAQAFCLWDGGFLPTEAEWNNAAAAGAEQRAFPWSSPAGSLTVDSSRAVYSTSAVDDVGSRPAGDGAYGHADLAGNLWEWTVENYASPYSITPCENCARDDGGITRTFRGGGFQDVADQLRVGTRNVENADTRWWYIGARCARPL